MNVEVGVGVGAGLDVGVGFGFGAGVAVEAGVEVDVGVGLGAGVCVGLVDADGSRLDVAEGLGDDGVGDGLVAACRPCHAFHTGMSTGCVKSGSCRDPNTRS